MKVPSLLVFASFALFRFSRAADARGAEDYARRNEPFAARSGTAVERLPLVQNTSVQEKRAAQPPLLEKNAAPVAGGRAAIDVAETGEKLVHPIPPRPLEVRAATFSPLNRRETSILPAASARKPPTVAKYQDSLSAASATNMARFPALSSATTAKLNRFVFRRNAPAPEAASAPAFATPAAGGAAIPK